MSAEVIDGFLSTPLFKPDVDDTDDMVEDKEPAAVLGVLWKVIKPTISMNRSNCDFCFFSTRVSDDCVLYSICVIRYLCYTLGSSFLLRVQKLQ